MVPLPSASTCQSSSWRARKTSLYNHNTQCAFAGPPQASLIMSCNSASVGFWPSERITVPSSFLVETLGASLFKYYIKISPALVVMVPSPSLSNREKASLNSAICSWSTAHAKNLQKSWQTKKSTPSSAATRQPPCSLASNTQMIVNRSRQSFQKVKSEHVTSKELALSSVNWSAIVSNERMTRASN